MKIYIALLLLFGIATAHAVDLCEPHIPPSLKIELVKAFPSFRPPVSTDNSPEDIERSLKDGGTGCFGASEADFDGDGVKDYIFGLTARKGNGSAVVVAFARGQGWEFQTLQKWAGGRARLYVGFDKSGVYERTEALDGPLEEGEVDPLKCPQSFAIFGAIESSGVAYCYNKGKWKHVWISD